MVQRSLHSLLNEFELVVIEGAGSPAEVNLKAGDIVDMRVALEARARVLLVADIDRGGAFAHLLGTWACLEDEEKSTLLGFVLNKFRGDPALLEGGTAWLEARTSVPTVGVLPLPYLPLALPEEDAHTLGVGASGMLGGHKEGLNVAVVRLLTVSNFDEFDALAAEPAISLRWVDTPAALAGADLIIVSGSKHVVADGVWLQRTGLAERIKGLAAQGVAILGVCGGLQLLGRHIHDPHGVEGEGGLGVGLELLELDTTLAPEKITRRTQVEFLATRETVTGYEIHHGRSRAWGETQPCLAAGLGFRRGSVTGVYLHGLFEDTAFRRSFLAELGLIATATAWSAQLESTLDTLADHVEAHLDLAAIDKALTPPRRRCPLPSGSSS